MLLIIVHRLLQSFVLPPLNAMLIMIIGFITPKKFPKFKKSLLALGLLFLYIQSTPLFSYQVSKLIEPEPIALKTIKDCQAIVVLGGGVNPEAYEYPVHVAAEGVTLTRLKYAAYLAKHYPHKPVIVSGGFTSKTYSEARIMGNTLRSSFGVKNPIIVEDHSRNTSENAKFAAIMLMKHNISKVALVTSELHMRRASMLFKKYGMQVVMAPTDYTTSNDANTKALAFVPTAHSMSVTARILHELIGYEFDRVFHN